MRRAISRVAVAAAIAAVSLTAAVASAAGAGATAQRAQAGGGAGALPTLSVALTGAHGISVSGSMVSGAVNVVSTFTGHGQGQLGIVRLDPGVTIEQAAGAVQSRRGNLNALTPFATLLVSTQAPGAVQTLLTPGSYVALNVSGNGQPGFAPFTVTQAANPAALPAARATQSTIEFAFRGPSVLHDHTVVRMRNDGFLVHMITLAGVRNRATGRAVMTLLRAGRDRAAQRLSNGLFVGLMGPASPGALQQETLNVKPGWYVEACFMDTGDGREHTQLGMVRLIRVVA